MRVAFLGFGLIAGSIARALRRPGAESREPGPLEIVAWSPSGRGPAEAMAAGVVDAAAGTIREAIAGTDLVVLAGPPLACVALVTELAGPLRDALPQDATVTDVASTKAMVVATADRAGLPFVGGHPMAGRETSGFGASDAELFASRPWVVVPGVLARPRDVERVEWLARASGAEPIPMTAEGHDAAVAAISHLPLIVAVSLVEAVVGEGGAPHDGDRVDWPASRRLAASGWRDMTRLARGDVEMSAGIAATNPLAIAARLRDLRAMLDSWIVDLEATAAIGSGSEADLAALTARFAAARARLEPA